MGNNQTRPDSPYTASIAPFSPSPGITNRDNYFQQNESLNLETLTPPFVSSAPISPPFYGKWSVIRPDKYPEPRYGQCYVHDPQTESIIVAYGIGSNGKYLNDLWILNLFSYTWELLLPALREPRIYSSACLIGRQMFIFGGYQNRHYFSDLHIIDLDTLTITPLNLSGPSPRQSSFLFSRIPEKSPPMNFLLPDNNFPCSSPNDTALFLWSGFDGQILSDFYELSFFEHKWIEHPPLAIPGRAAGSYCIGLSNNISYVVGSTKGHPLASFDSNTASLTMLKCTGPSPPPEVNHPMFCAADEYLFVFGGEKESEFSHIYALNVERKTWMPFHILPDGETLTLADGNVNKNGLFQVPRQHSGIMAYCEKTRTLISTFGSLLQEHSPIYQIAIGEALAILHQRNDMIQMLYL